MKSRTYILLAIVIIITLAFILGCSKAASPAPAPAAPAPAPAVPAPAPAAPVKIIELSLASALPPMHGTAVALTQWAKELSERTQGGVKIIPYWGSSLVRSGTEYDSVVQGVADIGTQTPTYAVGRFPVLEIIELPWPYPPSSIVSSAIAYDVIMKYQPAEISDTHFYYSVTIPSCYLVGNKVVQTMEDVKGMQIRATGGNINKIVEALGGSPISMPLGDVYDALQKGTMDATLIGIDALQSFKLAEVAKYAIDITPCIGYTNVTLIFMNKNKWNSLPADVQKIFNEVSPKYVGINAELFDKAANAAIEFGKGKGVKFIQLSPQEQQRWAVAMKPIRDQAIESASAKGIPTKDVASFIEESIKKYSK